MDQKISQMTEQTTASMTEAGTADFLGGYTATGGTANRKFSLSGLANYFLNKFKMTLGGSSQTVKSAIDTLNSKKRPYFSEATFTSGADLNQIFYGTYCCNTSALHNSILHKPDGMGTAIWRFTVVPLTNDGASNPTTAANWSRRAQIIYTGEKEYWRVYQVDGSGNIDWGNWVETPKRSEITALDSKLPYYEAPINVTTEAVSRTLGKSLASYSMMMISYYVNNSGFLGSAIVPISSFKTMSNGVNVVRLTNTSEYATVTYVDDTHITAKTTDTGNRYIAIMLL